MPADPTTLPALIAALREATVGSRELDERIALALGSCCLHKNEERSGAQSDMGYTCLDCGADSWGNKGRTGQRLNDRLPSWTTCLDAALTLVPAGPWCWTVSGAGEHHRMPEAEVGHFRGRAATPALALCIAALMARGAG